MDKKNREFKMKNNKKQNLLLFLDKGKTLLYPNYMILLRVIRYLNLSPKIYFLLYYLYKLKKLKHKLKKKIILK
jgi:hypothetical protein